MTYAGSRISMVGVRTRRRRCVVARARSSYVPPDDAPPLDIMSRLGERFRFADLEREDHDVEGQIVSVATPATLYRMKKATVRPIDHQDAARLAEAFDLNDEDGNER